MAKTRQPESALAASPRRDAERYLMNTYKRPPLVFVKGKGCYLYDDRGHEYLDFLGGIAVNALGYSHPRLVRMIRREAARAAHLSNLFHNEFQGPLARHLCRISGMDRVFFANSGSEAVETALKLARIRARHESGPADGGKTRILALENSFHGRTFGALSITSTEKYRAPYAPLVPGVEFVRFNDVADLEVKFDSSVCALVVEAIQGEGGIHAISDEFWKRARELATARGAALIADEIQCGLGRTGRYFAYQRFEPAGSGPDMVTVAKPLGGGLPLGALLARESFAAAFSPGLHGSTFGGGPLVCAVALEFLRVVEDADLLKNVRARGEQIRGGLEKLKERFELIREIRGEGLMLGLELSVPCAPYVAEALRQGLVINCTHDYTLRFLPPFIIGNREVREFFEKLEMVLRKTRLAAA